MSLKIAYSRDEEIKPLRPILEGKINNRGFEIQLEKIKEDEIKFNLDKYDLLYIPLPVLQFGKDIKVLTNGSYVIDKLYIKRLSNSSELKILVNGTNSTEFYLAKIFVNLSIIPNFKDYNAVFTTEEGDIDIYEEWKNVCGNLPIVISLLGSKKLKEEELLKVKVLIRDSASYLSNQGLINPLSKELGLKGREAIDCFFKLCKEKRLCGDVKFSLL